MASAALVTACSAEIEPDGPLWLGDVYAGESRHDEPPGGTTGLEAEHFSGKIVVNAGILHNKDDAPVVITDVSAISAKNMKQFGAFLVPEPEKDENGLITYWPGTGQAYPPPDEKEDARSWDEHIEAVGATLQPGKTWVLVLGVDITESRASLRRVRVHYVDEGGQKYERLNRQSVVVAPADELQEATDNFN